MLALHGLETDTRYLSLVPRSPARGVGIGRIDPLATVAASVCRPSALGRAGNVLDALTDGDVDRGLALAPASGRAALHAAYDAAYGGAVGRLLLVTAGVALCGAVLTLVLVRQGDLLAQPATAQ